MALCSVRGSLDGTGVEDAMVWNFDPFCLLFTFSNISYFLGNFDVQMNNLHIGLTNVVMRHLTMSWSALAGFNPGNHHLIATSP